VQERERDIKRGTELTPTNEQRKAVVGVGEYSTALK
jgi:hypothetical protein